MRAAVVAHRDAPPVLEPAEAVFDLVALFVEGLVVSVLGLAVLLRRDAGLDALFDQGLAKGVAVVALVAGQRLGGRQRRQQEGRPFVIAHLTWSKQ